MQKKKVLGIKNVDIKMPKVNPGSWFGLAKHRDRDWNTLLWTTLSVAVIVSVLSFYMFYSIEAGTFFRNLDIGNGEGIGLDVSKIVDVTNLIKEGEYDLGSLLSNKPSTYDPSI